MTYDDLVELVEERYEEYPLIVYREGRQITIGDTEQNHNYTTVSTYKLKTFGEMDALALVDSVAEECAEYSFDCDNCGSSVFSSDHDADEVMGLCGHCVFEA